MRKKKVYIHYGASKFDPNHKLGGGWCGKPDGFWGSPKYSDWNWRRWCVSEDFHTDRLNKCIKFKLKKGTKILNVNHVKDIIPYLRAGDGYKRDLYLYYDRINRDPTFGMDLDIDKLKRDYDGMELHMGKNYEELHYSSLFYSWDVDSIVVWNLDKIIQIR